MFTKLIIENFKCLGDFSRDLGDLTLLTGLNATGKSSVIQALALLHQTASESEWSKALYLNGSSVQLGTMFDVIDRNTGGSGFRLGVSTQNWNVEWQTTSEDRASDLVARLSRIAISTDNFIDTWSENRLALVPVRRLIPEPVAEEKKKLFEEMRFKLASISHVGAERIGPREVYVTRSPLSYPAVGARGEETAWCLEQFENAEINPSLELPGVPTSVGRTVTAWMEQFFPGFQYQIKRVDGANLLTMGIRTSPRGDYFRPTNVGFGITHILPIITACVSATPGRLIVVENPETHLHPAGQSLIGAFLAVAAAKGVQVLVETHSDHVLNGVRRVIADRKLRSDAVRIYFFDADEGKGGEAQTVVHDVKIDHLGHLHDWPEGFFDQMEADLDYIFRT